MEYGLKVIAAIIILIVGWWLAKLLRRTTSSLLSKRNVDPIIVSFLGNLVYVGLLVFVVIFAMDKVGIETASFADACKLGEQIMDEGQR